MYYRMSKLPYMEAEMRFKVEGKGAVRPTVFNVIGHTKYDSSMKSLGGLVKEAKSHANVGSPVEHARGLNTERHIVGKNATKVSGQHFGQVPYAGAYMSPLGKRL